MCNLRWQAGEDQITIAIIGKAGVENAEHHCWADAPGGGSFPWADPHPPTEDRRRKAEQISQINEEWKRLLSTSAQLPVGECLLLFLVWGVGGDERQGQGQGSPHKGKRHTSHPLFCMCAWPFISYLGAISTSEQREPSSRSQLHSTPLFGALQLLPGVSWWAFREFPVFCCYNFPGACVILHGR